MAHTPPRSPIGVSYQHQLPSQHHQHQHQHQHQQQQQQRPFSAIIRPTRSDSRNSSSSKRASGSRASDDDGKTAVKVAVRVRPPLKPADPGYDLIPQRFQRSIAHVTSPTSLTVESPQGRKLFVFDRVFGEDVTQDGIWEYISESIDAFVQGYNVSVLAYGQSGSGKSYTMGTAGPHEQVHPDMKGIIPRAASSLFEKLGPSPPQVDQPTGGLRAPQRYSMLPSPAPKADDDKNWTMHATYVEIYNEQLRDLLVPDSIPLSERSAVIIREDVKGRILLTGLHQVAIKTVNDLLSALNFGSSIRQTDATAINAKSSRSHAIFSLNLIQRKSKGPSPRDKRRSVPVEAMTGAESWMTVDSKLHFVDLAGSERLKLTGAQGERAREGISINAGLASLGKVISQLSSRQAGSHVSYRDSKLTRVLQDSLGGNALTYMVACVTPTEFHLSETLNTVQYAQRARAIQSKPQIQQVSDEGDKQAVIDRLRAEIAFLRERIHGSERSPRPTDTPQSRNERLQEREADLQNRLLDLQESYFNLGQRHAKLLAEVAKAQEGQNRDGAEENENGTAHALERLKRSNSFAEAVEQVLLEYEKTIQSLETSLAQTRSSLSATESELLEKETKCAYTETVNRQLEARVQKMMEREASTEHYLTDLEAKLSGHTSGEEKNAALVLELRKEIARVRESEANCEDYISTLEERLAEADQDAELMQREIERLEHVVERQRSLGRLEVLMQELDQTQQRPKTPDLPTVDVDEQLLPDDGVAAAEEQVGTASVRGGDHIRDRLPSSPPRSDKTQSDEGDTVPPSTPAPNAAYSVPSPAQTDFVVEKLETVTQELLDLRVEHETTINEFELLAAKYEEALRTISQLQDGVDETRHPVNKDVFTTPASTRPSSFLGGARMSELKDTQFSSSRSLSLELFSAGESPNISEPSDADTHPPRTHVLGMPQSQLDTQPFLNEIAHLKRLQLEKDEAMSSLEGQYEQLREQHHAVLDEVEELKTEISKAKMNGAIGAASPIIRRKSSQGVMMVDRAHRSFASLRNIATENLEDRPDVMQSFEINLNAAMHELYARSERVQELEAEIASIKKEMEAKMTIISGLTRERSSLKKTSPMDMSMMSSMRDQLLENENKMRVLQETQEVREKTLLAEIDELRALLDGVGAPLPASAAEPAVNEDANSHQQDQKILELQGELEKWKSRHQATVESMQASESKLLATIKDMERALEELQSRPPVTHAVEPDDEKYIALQKSAEATLEQERTRHQETVTSLQQKIEEYASSIDAYARRVEDLEHTGDESRRDLEERLRTAESTEKELESHRALVSLLEQRVADHEATIRAHEEELMSAKEAHARELEELQNFSTGLIATRLSEQTSAHQVLISSLQGEVTEARDEMGRLLQGLAESLGTEVAAEKVQAQVQALVRQRADVIARLRALQEQTETLQGETRTMKATITELTSLNEASVKEIERLNEEYQKSSRLVEELEEQLTANFDQHQIASNRLSLLESEHIHRFEELVTSKNQAMADLEAAKEEIARLEAKLYKSPTNGTFEETRQRSASVTSNIHKSTSVASLPSPPPAIPLPPLPTNATPAPPPPGTPLGAAAAAVSRTTSRELSSPQPPPPPPDEHESRIRSVENALYAEKQLNYALEEALADLENQGKKAKEDLEAWKKKAWAYEDEIEALKNSQRNNRLSMQAVEEARIAHRKAEAARAQLEERMNALNKKKKKSSLNCF